MSKSDLALVERWRAIGPIAWAESPEFGWLIDGKPIQLEPWQRAILGAWWALRFVITTLAISLCKKCGKTTLDAILTAWRFLSLPGTHYCAANDEEQAQSRVFAMIAEMVEKHPYLSKRCKITKSEIEFLPTGSKLIALANDAAGIAGGNFITTSHTEAGLILYEQGRRSWDELTPVPDLFFGVPCLRIADSYAGFLNESQTWHTLIDRGLQGARVSDEWPIYKIGGLLLIHDEGEAAAVRYFRGTEEQAIAYLDEQRASLRALAFQRMHCNTRTPNESAFITPEMWAACYDNSIVRWKPGDKRKMFMGCDASTAKDSTGLIGVWLNPQTNRVEVIYKKLWLPNVIQTAAGLFRGGKASIDLLDVRDTVLQLHQQGAIQELLFDVYQLSSISLEWTRAGVPCRELPQGGPRIECDEALHDSIANGGIAHDGDKELGEHISNAIFRESVRGARLDKQKASKKIDLAVCLSMCSFAATKRGERAIYVPPAGVPYSSVDAFAKIIEDWFADVPDARDATTFVSDGAGGSVEVLQRTMNREHRKGITWRDCGLRGDGCWACVCELAQEGFYQNERRIAERKRAELGGEQTSEEVANLDFLNRLGIPDRLRQQQQEDYHVNKFISEFERAARERQLASKP